MMLCAHVAQVRGHHLVCSAAMRQLAGGDVRRVCNGILFSVSLRVTASDVRMSMQYPNSTSPSDSSFVLAAACNLPPLA